VTLTAYAAERRRARRPQLSIDIFCPQGAQLQTRLPPLPLSIDGTVGRTDERTDARPLDRPCSAYYVGSYDNLDKKGKGSPYSITERRVPELIPVLGSQPAGDVSHELGGRLPLLFARPAVTPATLKMAATSFAAW